MAFTTYDPASDSLTSLVGAIFSGSAGASLVNGSISVVTGASDDEPSSISYYDGSLAALGIGAGLLLTSGDPTPATTNTSAGASNDVSVTDPNDDDLLATVNHVFADATIEDLTYLQFQINVTDPLLTGLRFDVVFGSEEYPEWSDQFVDVAGVYVNDVNYALFGGSDEHPLSVIQSNIDAGYFIDNDPWELDQNDFSANLPIEYDGVSVKLQITAPVHQGVNTIKIAIADTDDSNLDSGIFVSSLQAVNYTGFGLSQQVPVDDSQEVTDTGGNQTYLGNALKNLIKLISGQDVVNGGGGIDEVVVNYLLSSYHWDGSQLGLTGAGGNSSQLIDVERVELAAYGGALIALDTSPGGNAFGVMALFQAALNTTLAVPSTSGLPYLMDALSPVSHWISVADDLAGADGNLGDVADAMLNDYAQGVPNTSLISLLYHNIFGGTADAATVDSIAALVGTPAFPTMGDLFAAAALLPQNTAELDAAGFTGSILVLDPSDF